MASTLKFRANLHISQPHRHSITKQMLKLEIGKWKVEIRAKKKEEPPPTRQIAD